MKALPTFLLVLVLHFYLKQVFFKPLQRVLDARYEATEGARKQAEASLERASTKAAQYEQAMRAARADVYAAQEHLHRELEEHRKSEVASARAKAEQAVVEAKAALAREVEDARRSLAQDTEALAEQIARSIAGGRAA